MCTAKTAVKYDERRYRAAYRDVPYRLYTVSCELSLDMRIPIQPPSNNSPESTSNERRGLVQERAVEPLRALGAAGGHARQDRGFPARRDAVLQSVAAGPGTAQLAPRLGYSGQALRPLV